jgi:hypothetical protein
MVYGKLILSPLTKEVTTMPRFTRVGTGILLTLAVCGMTPGVVQAQFTPEHVNFDDLGEGIPIVTADRPAALTILKSGPEFVSFTYLEFAPASTTITVFTDLLDPGTTTVSDRLVLSQTQGSALITGIFGSDPTLPAIPPNAVPFFPPRAEDGTFQLLAIYSEPLPFNNTFYQAASDVMESHELPEPSSLILLALGAVGLLGRTWRRWLA